jgi:hypothetical protein
MFQQNPWSAYTISEVCVLADVVRSEVELGRRSLSQCHVSASFQVEIGFHSFTADFCGISMDLYVGL